MLRVVTLSTLFPNRVQPTFGNFVACQATNLAALPDVELRVVSGIGLPPWPLRQHPHYSARARLPVHEQWLGLEVHRPRFRVWPKLGEAATAKALARSALPLLRRLRESFRFDVIAADFFWPDGVAAMHLSKDLQVPFTIKARGADIHFWGGRPGIQEQIVAAGCSASKILAVSEALKSDMVELGMPSEKISVHYTGVDLERFRPLNRSSLKLEMGVDGPLLITVGALIPRKGQRLTIEMLKHIPRARLMIVGEGPDRAGLEKFSRAAGLADRVQFLGGQPNARVAQLLAAADVMVLPSSSEGIANAWVESLACGTPIVISDVGGARELLQDESAGRIVPRDSLSMAAATRSLLESTVEPEAVRAAVANRFSWERNARELRTHLVAASSTAPADLVPTGPERQAASYV